MEMRIVSRDKYTSIFDFVWNAWIYRNTNNTWKSVVLFLLVLVPILIGLTYGYSTPTFKLKIIILISLFICMGLVPLMQWYQKISINNDQISIMLGKLKIKSFKVSEIDYIKKSNRFNSAYELRFGGRGVEYLFWDEIPEVLKSRIKE